MLQKGVVYRARAPLRLSFGGGGTELSPYVEKHGGVVLNATIGRYVYAMLTAEEDKVVFTAADCDLHEELPLADEYPTSGNDIKLKLHRAVYNRIIRDYCNGQPLPLRLHTYSEAPVGSGLGTSSTLTVAMTCCFEEALHLNFDEYKLAALAHNIERDDLGLSGGYQDHYAAAFGGFNLMEFRANNEVIVNALRIRPWILAELEYSLLLYFTGVSRDSGDIIDAQKENITKDKRVEEAMHEIKRLAVSMKDRLLIGDLAGFASALHDSWQFKRSTAKKISNDDIDHYYQQACASGAWGGKISGAGGGGFMMLMVDPVQRSKVLKCLPDSEKQNTFCNFSRGGVFSWRT